MKLKKLELFTKINWTAFIVWAFLFSSCNKEPLQEHLDATTGITSDELFFNFSNGPEFNRHIVANYPEYSRDLDAYLGKVIPLTKEQNTKMKGVIALAREAFTKAYVDTLVSRYGVPIWSRSYAIFAEEKALPHFYFVPFAHKESEESSGFLSLLVEDGVLKTYKFCSIPKLKSYLEQARRDVTGADAQIIHLADALNYKTFGKTVFSYDVYFDRQKLNRVNHALQEKGYDPQLRSGFTAIPVVSASCEGTIFTSSCCPGEYYSYFSCYTTTEWIYVATSSGAPYEDAWGGNYDGGSGGDGGSGSDTDSQGRCLFRWEVANIFVRGKPCPMPGGLNYTGSCTWSPFVFPPTCTDLGNAFEIQNVANSVFPPPRGQMSPSKRGTAYYIFSVYNKGNYEVTLSVGVQWKGLSAGVSATLPINHVFNIDIHQDFNIYSKDDCWYDCV